MKRKMVVFLLLLVMLVPFTMFAAGQKETAKKVVQIGRAHV